MGMQSSKQVSSAQPGLRSELQTGKAAQSADAINDIEDLTDLAKNITEKAPEKIVKQMLGHDIKEEIDPRSYRIE